MAGAIGADPSASYPRKRKQHNSLFTRSLFPVLLASVLAGCGGGSGGDNPGDGDGGGDGGTTPPGGDTTTSCPSVHIVDLSQDPLSLKSCARLGSQAEIADCTATEIRGALDAACLRSFDVFVPGTAAEHGAWKQFNSMFSRDAGRGYLSLQYQDSAVVEGLGNKFDAAAYDAGVLDANEALDQLLYTLNTRFKVDGQAPDVRVFGHSKGAHAVSLVSETAEFADMDFYAFAQPGRTGVDISSRSDVRAGKLGSPGYIQKLSDNLVGITWKNDEVQYYTGKGFNGIEIPEKWSYPGFIWQDTHDGGYPLAFRIDHHNNYGGLFSDGLENNDWRAGQGSKETQYPYCATGNSFFYSKSECDKSSVHYRPYFWDSADCRDKTFDMMNNSSINAKHYIGHSGPRVADCRESTSTISATYELEYRINIGDLNDGDCRLDIEILLGGLGDRPDGGAIKLSTSDVSNTGWKKKTGSIKAAPHMTLRVTATLTDIASGFRDCGGLSVAQTEAYLRSLKLKFTHPATGRSVNRSIIGLKEGSTAFPWPANLDMQNNVGWREQNSGDKFRLHYAPAPFESLMIKGDTNGGVRGRFYKWVHLLD